MPERHRFCDLRASTPTVVTIYAQGDNQSVRGKDKVKTVLNCHLATGRIGRPGAEPFSMIGQHDAMGRRAVGGPANMLANHLDVETVDHHVADQEFWDSPYICVHPGLKAVDLFHACADSQIKARWAMSTNSAVSMTDADNVAAAIRNVAFIVVSDIMSRSDTGDLADVLLHTACWGEKRPHGQF